VLPVYNEELNISVLAMEIDAVADAEEIQFECIWVDDCSTDGSWLEIQKLGGRHRGMRLAQNTGQSTALMAGIDASRSEYILTMDSDLQNDPRDIPKFLVFFDSEIDVICGYRLNRKDSWFNRKLPSLIANKLAQKITRVPVRDLGCTMRLFKKSLLDRNRILGEMHRVIVLHFFLAGANIKEIPTTHRRRIHGTSKYGLERTFKFIADIVLAKTMNVISSKPLYFFGSFALGTLTASIALFLVALGLRIFNIKEYIDSSFVTASMIMFSLSLILLSIGLVAEMIVRGFIHNNIGSQYSISETCNVAEGP
jgi:dolichol-phosphate mannosyltransferase